MLGGSVPGPRRCWGDAMRTTGDEEGSVVLGGSHVLERCAHEVGITAGRQCGCTNVNVTALSCKMAWGRRNMQLVIAIAHPCSASRAIHMGGFTWQCHYKTCKQQQRRTTMLPSNQHVWPWCLGFEVAFHTQHHKQRGGGSFGYFLGFFGYFWGFSWGVTFSMR